MKIDPKNNSAANDGNLYLWNMCRNTVTYTYTKAKKIKFSFENGFFLKFKANYLCFYAFNVHIKNMKINIFQTKKSNLSYHNTVHLQKKSRKHVI